MNMKSVLTVFFLVYALLNMNAQTSSEKRYMKTFHGYLMVLKQGDNVFEQLELLMKQEKIPGAVLTGIGFADMEIGHFNAKKKKYKSKHFKGGEVAVLHGSLAWKGEQPSVHIHGVLGNKHDRARAGHILQATVGTGTLEINILLYTKKLERKRDEELGADVLQIAEE
jgi:hypothetical protein